MSNEVSTGRADYMVGADGVFKANASLLDLRRRIEELQAADEMMNAAFCGAFIFALFRRHPWLDRLELDLWASSEYDDSGGSYRSASLRVAQVEVRDGMSVPDAVLELDSSNPLSVEDALADGLEAYAGDFYAALRDDGDQSEFSLSFARVDVADLLNEPSVSAREAFVRLFTDYAYLVRAAEGKY